MINGLAASIAITKQSIYSKITNSFACIMNLTMQHSKISEGCGTTNCTNEQGRGNYRPWFLGVGGVT